MAKELVVAEAIMGLQNAGVPMDEDFYALKSEDVNKIVGYGKAVGYRAPKNASGSYGRYAYRYFQKQGKKIWGKHFKNPTTKNPTLKKSKGHIGFLNGSEYYRKKEVGGKAYWIYQSDLTKYPEIDPYKVGGLQYRPAFPLTVDGFKERIQLDKRYDTNIFTKTLPASERKNMHWMYGDKHNAPESVQAIWAKGSKNPTAGVKNAISNPAYGFYWKEQPSALAHPTYEYRYDDDKVKGWITGWVRQERSGKYHAVLAYSWITDRYAKDAVFDNFGHAKQYIETAVSYAMINPRKDAPHVTQRNPSEPLKGAIATEIESSKLAIEQAKEQQDKTEEYITTLEKLTENPVHDGWQKLKEGEYVFRYNGKVFAWILQIGAHKFQAQILEPNVIKYMMKVPQVDKSSLLGAKAWVMEILSECRRVSTGRMNPENPNVEIGQKRNPDSYQEETLNAPLRDWDVSEVQHSGCYKWTLYYHAITPMGTRELGYVQPRADGYEASLNDRIDVNEVGDIKKRTIAEAQKWVETQVRKATQVVRYSDATKASPNPPRKWRKYIARIVNVKTGAENHLEYYALNKRDANAQAKAQVRIMNVTGKKWRLGRVEEVGEDITVVGIENPRNIGWYTSQRRDGVEYSYIDQNAELGHAVKGMVTARDGEPFCLAKIKNADEGWQQFGSLKEAQKYVERGVPRTKRNSAVEENSSFRGYEWKKEESYGLYVWKYIKRGRIIAIIEPVSGGKFMALYKESRISKARSFNSLKLAKDFIERMASSLRINPEIEGKGSIENPITRKVVWSGAKTKYRPEGMRVSEMVATDNNLDFHGIRKGDKWYLVEALSSGKWVTLKEHKSKAVAIKDARDWYKSSPNAIITENGEAENLQKFDNTIKDLSKMFQGKVTGQSKSVLASDLQPSKTARIGQLAEVVIDTPKKQKLVINFDGESFVSMDRRKNLWLSGTDSRLKKSQTKLPNGVNLTPLGHLKKLNYITAKKHIENGETVEFYHRLGEVDGETPIVYVDKDGFLIIVGGNYDVWDVGIVN